VKQIDRIFGCLLLVGTVGHTIGTILWTQPMSALFIWSLGSSLSTALLGTLNLVRAGRPRDKTLAVITAIGTACLGIHAFAFGVSIGNVLDPRALFHMVVSAVLVLFSLRTLRGRAEVVERCLPVAVN
jgi:hypothetical protein